MRAVLRQSRRWSANTANAAGCAAKDGWSQSKLYVWRPISSKMGGSQTK